MEDQNDFHLSPIRVQDVQIEELKRWIDELEKENWVLRGDDLSLSYDLSEAEMHHTKKVSYFTLSIWRNSFTSEVL